VGNAGMIHLRPEEVFEMLATVSLSSLCCSLLTLFAMFGSPLHASVTYIANCCNHSSTVSVFDSASGRQNAAICFGAEGSRCNLDAALGLTKLVPAAER
jgi:hypothetical protein